jgi:hypothetical protein
VRVLIFPFPRGITLRLVDCGLTTKARQSVSDKSGKKYNRTEVNWKDVSALLNPTRRGPDLRRGLGEFGKGQGTTYPKWDMGKADENSERLDKFKKILGELVDLKELDSEKTADEEVRWNQGEEGL